MEILVFFSPFPLRQPYSDWLLISRPLTTLAQTGENHQILAPLKICPGVHWGMNSAPPSQ